MFTPKPYGSNSKTLKICYPPPPHRSLVLLEMERQSGENSPKTKQKFFEYYNLFFSFILICEGLDKSKTVPIMSPSVTDKPAYIQTNRQPKN